MMKMVIMLGHLQKIRFTKLKCPKCHVNPSSLSDFLPHILDFNGSDTDTEPLPMAVFQILPEGQHSVSKVAFIVHSVGTIFLPIDTIYMHNLAIHIFIYNLHCYVIHYS